jgi:hypothetical protein
MLSNIEAPFKTEATRLGRGLTIYKQPKAVGRGSPYWYVRANVDVAGRKVHTKTTGTSDMRLATERAHDFLGELLAQKHTGVPMANGELSDRAYRFDVIADEWLDSLFNAAGDEERKVRRYHDHRKIMMAPNGLLAFFGKSDVRVITTRRIENYLDFASQGSKGGRFKPTTKKNHLSTISKFLNFAVDLGCLERLPRMPTVKAKDEPRPAFADWEYRLLRSGCRASERHAWMASDLAAVRAWKELRDFIVFMVNAFLRPSEWADLKQKHIEIVDTGENPHLRITVVNGKTRKRVALTMPGAVRAYRRIIQRCGVDPERYVFMPQYGNRATAKERMSDRFNELLELTGLADDPFGRKRTIYSLRHTALMLRVLKGDNVDLLALARNAGTSVRMLDRFYCSHLQPEQKLANLQSFRA